MKKINKVLEERGKNYGDFNDFSELFMDFHKVCKKSKSISKCTPIQKVSLYMILHKITRIINGDPSYIDSWVDITGYAQLVIDNYNKKANK